MHYDSELDKQLAEELRTSLRPAAKQPKPEARQALAVAKPAERVLAQYRQPGYAASQAQLMRSAGRGKVQPYHLLNLARLAEHLRGLPADYAHFEMESWQGGAFSHIWSLLGPLGRPGELVPGMCGTTACAVGHAPNAGMGVRRPFEGWTAYSERLFGDQFHTACFRGEWSHYDNTVRGAAARILYCLDHPKDSWPHPECNWGMYTKYEA